MNADLLPSFGKNTAPAMQGVCIILYENKFHNQYLNLCSGYFRTILIEGQLKTVSAEP